MALVTLVAPMLPLPTFLRSTFPKYLANMTPVGIEPIKYEIMERNMAGRKMADSETYCFKFLVLGFKLIQNP